MADLQKARIVNCNFCGVNFWRVDLRDTTLEKCDLTDSDLRLAYAPGANLNHCQFAGAKLDGADLRNANLIYSVDILFSGNEISGYRVNHKTTGPWLTLKNEYTGAMTLYHLLLVVAFFSPYFAKAAYWESYVQRQLEFPTALRQAFCYRT